MSVETPTISLICPAFNEEAVVELFLQETTIALTQLNYSYEIVFINDGSTDATLEKLQQLKKNYPFIRIINLSRNFGKEAALTAGIDYAKGKVIIPIDVDLQHPPRLISEFMLQYEAGYDVVLAKRVDRASDSLFKKIASVVFYRLHNAIAQPNIPENVGDYRLMTRKVVKALQQLPENQRFMKGIFSWVGFKTTTVEFTCPARKVGKTAFNGWKLWNFALDGITSFSTVPLRIWLYLGLVVSALSFIYGSFIVLRTLIWGVDLPGYASLFTSILFLGGIQLIGIGVLGEYIGRIYLESKRRPPYIVEDEY